MVTALGRYTSVRRAQALSWWFHDSGSCEMYQCVSGTADDLFDWLAHVLMMADKWCPQRAWLAEDYRSMATLIGDALLRHWLANTVVSEDMGLSADWSVSAFLVEPDATLASLATQYQHCGAAWLVDESDTTPHAWSIVRRWAPDESGRMHSAGLPFPQSAYDHADQFRTTVPTCGEDYIGQEGAAMSAPAAYAEVSRRLGIKASPAPAPKAQRPTLQSPLGQWAHWLEGQGFPDACVDADSVFLFSTSAYRVHLIVDEDGVTVWVNMFTSSRTVPMAITGSGYGNLDMLTSLLGNARALMA